MPFFPTDIENRSVKPLGAEQTAKKSSYSSVLDLNQLLIHNAASTFFAQVEGHEGDLLLIDKSLEPTHEATVVAYIHGEFILKRYEVKAGRAHLCAQGVESIPLDEEAMIWGVVRYYIKKM